METVFIVKTLRGTALKSLTVFESRNDADEYRTRQRDSNYNNQWFIYEIEEYNVYKE